MTEQQQLALLQFAAMLAAAAAPPAPPRRQSASEAPSDALSRSIALRGRATASERSQAARRDLWLTLTET